MGREPLHTFPLLITQGRLLVLSSFPVLFLVQRTQTGRLAVCASLTKGGFPPCILRRSCLCILSFCTLTEVWAMSHRPLPPRKVVEEWESRSTTSLILPGEAGE